jgi:hypothetical protein
VQWFKDTRFKNRLKNAIDEFYAYRRGKDNGLALGAEEALYETATFSVPAKASVSRMLDFEMPARNFA